ncbi:uncharacterized protein [Amphiura filiformis]|uniref:uncharacterized protein n=1 Tax=Amphiura filiformis TaxID=82378 RepID=UPI003B2280A3
MTATQAQSDDIARVILWCVPRTCSTAFLKCMTYVPDSQVWYEPYLMGFHFSDFAHRKTSIALLRDYWGGDIKEDDENDFTSGISAGYSARDKPFSWFKEQLESSPPNKKVIFSKDMCWGIDGHYSDMPRGFRHSFLIRHPYRVFDSYRKSLNNGMEEGSPMVNITDIPEHLLPKGLYYKEMHDLYMYVKDHFEPNPVIIDTDDLLADPGRVLKAYCQEVGIPYTDDLLQWKSGRECMDQLWMIAKGEILSNDIGGFHSATFVSTGFNKPTPLPDRSQLSEDVLVCSDQSMEHYNEIYENRLKV